MQILSAWLRGVASSRFILGWRVAACDRPHVPFRGSDMYNVVV